MRVDDRHTEDKNIECRNVHVGMAGVQGLAEKRVWKGKDYPECSGDQKRIPLVSSADAQQPMYKRKLSECRSRSGTTPRAGAQVLPARAGNDGESSLQKPNELCWTHKKNQAEKQAFSYIKTAQCGSNTLDSSTQEVEGVGFLSSRPGWLI